MDSYFCAWPYWICICSFPFRYYIYRSRVLKLIAQHYLLTFSFDKLLVFVPLFNAPKKACLKAGGNLCCSLWKLSGCTKHIKRHIIDFTSLIWILKSSVPIHYVLRLWVVECLNLMVDKCVLLLFFKKSLQQQMNQNTQSHWSSQ